MSIRPMTPNEQEDLRIALIEAGAIGQNVVACKCGRTIRSFPNVRNSGGLTIVNCLLAVPSCDWCNPGAGDKDGVEDMFGET